MPCSRPPSSPPASTCSHPSRFATNSLGSRRSSIRPPARASGTRWRCSATTCGARHAPSSPRRDEGRAGAVRRGARAAAFRRAGPAGRPGSPFRGDRGRRPGAVTAGRSQPGAAPRGLRSGVGTWTFAHGGFVLEGGRGGTDHGGRVAPLLARLAFPPGWRCVVAVPRGKPGLAGDQEAAAFARLPAPDARDVERGAHLVLMQLLPALAEADLMGFGAALEEVQRITGGWFAPVQGGVFAPGETRDVVERLREWGAVGVGQSSWGPAVYGIVGDAVAARALADRVRGALGPGGAVYEGAFSPTGARVWRGDPSVSG